MSWSSPTMSSSFRRASSEPGAPHEREAHIRDYLRILSRRRYPALAVFVIVFAGVTIRSLLAPPVYRATTRILIEKAEVQNLAMVNPLYSAWDPDFYRTQVQIISSSATATKAARLLAQEAEAPASPAPGTGAPPATVRSGELERLVLAGLSVTPEKESKIITLSYVSSDPELAARIVNAVVRAYMQQLFEMKTSYSKFAIEWMTEKARDEGRRLEQAERALQEFMREQDVIAVGGRAGLVPERLSELSLELTKAESRRRELETVSQRLAAAADDPEVAETIPAVQEDPTLQAIRAQLVKAEQGVLELSRKYGQKHPAMIAARLEVEALQRKRLAEIHRVVGTVRNEYELARAREEDLRARLDAGKTEALAYGEKLTRYEELKRAVETNRQFYDTLMSRAKEESLTQQLQGVQVWTLEPAEVPTAPDGPKRARTILLGLLAGLVAGVGIAMFAEYLDNTVRSPEDLEAKTGIPVLGVIPAVRARGQEIEAAVLREPRLGAAESYRALRTSILLSSEQGPPQTILVTSAAPEEGKTATAVNLAAAIAHSGYSVLLVDADLRKPRVDRVFGIDPSRGLSTWLAGEDAEAALVDVEERNLRVLPAGPIPENPAELLGSRRMEELVRTLRERCDIIVFDSPPFLTVTDGLILSKLVQAVLFVTRAEKSTYDGVRRGIRALWSLGVEPLGLVLNAYDERGAGGYHYHYGEGYGEAGRPQARPPDQKV